MITKTKTKTLGLFSFASSSNINKQILIKIAKANQDRPHYKTSLYVYLCSCTNKNNRLYDPVFDSLIKKIRPDWFETRIELTKKLKKLLINIAKSGKKRPAHGTKFYTNFVGYTCKKSKSYDKEFKDIIQKIRPDWLYTRIQKADRKKQQIKDIAKNGFNKPKRKNILGVALKNYITKSSQSYDANFDKTIKKLRPDWFRK